MNSLSSCRKVKLFKFLDLALTFTLFLTQTLFANQPENSFWKERARQMACFSTASNKIYELPPVGGKSLSLLGTSGPFSDINKNPTKEKSHPLSHFVVRDNFDGDPSHQKILLIQDVHLNLEAQRNVAQGLLNLFEAKKVELVALEGASGKFDFRPYRNSPDKELTGNIADAFLREGWIGGPSYAGVTSEVEPPVYMGVDDMDHYQRNVSAILLAEKERKRARTILFEEGKRLARQKLQSYHPKLIELDSLYSRYLDGRLDMGEYLTALLDRTSDSEETSKLKQNGDVANFLKAYRLEKSINFALAEKERRDVFKKLAQKLDNKGGAELIELTSLLRGGELTVAEFYRKLVSILSQYGFSLDENPAFKEYTSYVLASDAIKADDLLSKVEEFSIDILLSRADSPEEKRLIRESRRLYLVKRLIEFTLTPDEWDEYKTTVPSSSFLVPGPNSLNSRNQEPGTRNVFNLGAFESFYREAEVRSERMAENLFSVMPTRQDKMAVLFTGGFHTPQITRILRERGMSYMVVSPKITKIEDQNGTAYLSAFTEEKSPLEKLFEGEKLSVLSARTLLGAQGRASSFVRRFFAFLQSIIPQIPAQTGRMEFRLRGREILVKLGLTKETGFVLLKPLQIGSQIVSIFAKEDNGYMWRRFGLAVCGCLMVLGAIHGDLPRILAVGSLVAMVWFNASTNKSVRDLLGKEVNPDKPDSWLDPRDLRAYEVKPELDMDASHPGNQPEISDKEFMTIRDHNRQEALRMIRERVRQQYQERFQSLIQRHEKGLWTKYNEEIIYKRLRLDWESFTGEVLPERIIDLPPLMPKISEAVLKNLLNPKTFTIFWEGDIGARDRMLLAVFGQEYYELKGKVRGFVDNEANFDHSDAEARIPYSILLRHYLQKIVSESPAVYQLSRFKDLIYGPEGDAQLIFVGNAWDDLGEAMIELLDVSLEEISRRYSRPNIKRNVVQVWPDMALLEALGYGADVMLDIPSPGARDLAPLMHSGIAFPVSSRPGSGIIDSRERGLALSGISLVPPSGDVYSNRFFDTEAGMIYRILSELREEAVVDPLKWRQALRRAFANNLSYSQRMEAMLIHRKAELAQSLRPSAIKGEVKGDKLVIESKVDGDEALLKKAVFSVYWGNMENGERWKVIQMGWNAREENTLVAEVELGGELPPGHYGATIFALPSEFEYLDLNEPAQFPQCHKFMSWWGEKGVPNFEWDWKGNEPKEPENVKSGAMGLWRMLGLNLSTPLIGILEGGLTAGLPNLLPFSIYWAVLIVFSALLLGHKFTGIVNPDGTWNRHPTWTEALIATVLASSGFLGLPLVNWGFSSAPSLASNLLILAGVAVGSLAHGGINFWFHRRDLFNRRLEIANKIIGEVKEGKLQGGMEELLDRIEKMAPMRPLGVGQLNFPRKIDLQKEWQSNPRGLFDSLYLILFEILPNSGRVEKVKTVEALSNEIPESGKMTFVVRSDNADEAQKELASLRAMPILAQALEKKIDVDIVFSGLSRSAGTHLTPETSGIPGRFCFKENLNSYEKARSLLLSTPSGLEAQDISVLIPTGGADLPLPFLQALSDLQNSKGYKGRFQIFMLEALVSGAWAVRLGTDILKMKLFGDKLTLSNA